MTDPSCDRFPEPAYDRTHDEDCTCEVCEDSHLDEAAPAPEAKVTMFTARGTPPKLVGYLKHEESTVMAAALGVQTVLGGYLRVQWSGYPVGTPVGLGTVGGVRWWTVLVEQRIAGVPAIQIPPREISATNGQIDQIDRTLAGNASSSRAIAQVHTGLGSEANASRGGM